jgi:hypothetical protein
MQAEREWIMSSKEASGAAQRTETLQDDRSATFDPHQPTDHRQDRPPVVMFDPHFGSPSSGGGRDSRDFDEMMWEHAA